VAAGASNVHAVQIILESMRIHNKQASAPVSPFPSLPSVCQVCTPHPLNHHRNHTHSLLRPGPPISLTPRFSPDSKHPPSSSPGLCLHIYLFTYICIHIYICIHVYTYRYTCIHIYVYICMYTYMHIYIYIYACMCMYTYMHIFISKYINIRICNLQISIFIIDVDPWSSSPGPMGNDSSGISSNTSYDINIKQLLFDMRNKCYVRLLLAQRRFDAVTRCVHMYICIRICICIYMYIEKFRCSLKVCTYVYLYTNMYI
jgi:hypothetical protein